MAKLEFEVDYLSFDNKFEINDDGLSYVIYGSNGMGKSSIYKAIRKSYPQYDYIDYSDMKNNFIVGKSKELNVTPHAPKYNDLVQEKSTNIQKLDITDVLKRYDINSGSKAKSISDKLTTIQKEKRIIEKVTISKEKHDILSNFKENDIKFLLKYLEELKNISDIDEDIAILKNEYIKQALEQIENNIDDYCDVCPICDSKVPNLKKIIQDKLKTVEQIKTELLNTFKTENSESNNSDILRRFNSLLKISIKVSDEDIIDYMFIPEFEKAKEVNEILDVDSKLNIEIQTAQLEMVQSYENLKNIKEEYTSYISEKFDIKAEFSDTDYSVKIKLERHPKEYSTGEFNLILFATKIFEYVGSDKKLIILDDPISSYDIVNQYKIAFDIVISNKNGEKNFLIFTHNMSLINLLNSQKRGMFEFKMLDKIDKVIYLYNLNENGAGSIMNIYKFLSDVDENHNTKYIKLAMDRDNDAIDEDIQNQIHKLFHYNDFYEFSAQDYELYETGLTNQELCQIADNVDINYFDQNNYSELIIYKIVLMLGLRVWIEKKFYDALHGDKNYLGLNLLSEKIDYALPLNGTSRIVDTYPNISRIDLMSRKVMLNQHEHYKSQGEPFYYIMNLSVDDIYSEVLKIKNLFN